jgi:arabinogalactan oligomer/maltooligosaccharide transport system permease protein
MKSLSFIDYVALPRGQQLWYKISHGFVGFFLAIGRFFKGLGLLFVRLFKNIGHGFKKWATNFKFGDIWTKLSYFFLGTSQIARKQYVKGIMILLLEVAFIVYMCVFGGQALVNLVTLGEMRSGYVCSGDSTVYADLNELFNGNEQCFWNSTYETLLPDNSALMLLYGVLTILIIIAFIFLYFKVSTGSYELQQSQEEGRHISTFIEDVKSFLNSKFHITLLFLPIIGVLLFSILPTIDMVLMAFTSYDMDHAYPNAVFEWVGMDNFAKLFDFGGTFSYTFGKLLSWTIVWAIFATFLNFILGVLVATIINKKGIKFKKFWRTCLVLSIAVPQFVSLLAMSQFLGAYGPITELIYRWTGTKVLFLEDVTLARITIIVVNIWIGIPYTVLSTTGILMNVPTDLYESARIDGANAVTMYFKITLKYIIFVMGPSLITTFIGNFNNFGVIYLLTGGGPKTNSYYAAAGKTDLLVTWLYNLTTGSYGKYNLASVIGIIIFIISATLSLIVYRNSSSFKNEEDFA